MIDLQRGFKRFAEKEGLTPYQNPTLLHFKIAVFTIDTKHLKKH